MDIFNPVILKDMEIFSKTHPIIRIDEQIYPIDKDISISGGWSWNASEQILTLNGYRGGSISKTAGVLFLEIADGSANCVTNLNGDGINVNGCLKIYGNGTLNLTAQTDAGCCRGILAGSVEIEDASVRIDINTEGHGISSFSYVTIKKSRVQSSAAGRYAGIYAQGDVQITDGAYVDLSGDSLGIYCKSSISVSHSTLNIRCEGICGAYSAQNCSFKKASVLISNTGTEGNALSCTLVDADALSRIILTGKKSAISCVYRRIASGIAIYIGSSAMDAKTTDTFRSEQYVRIANL